MEAIPHPIPRTVEEVFQDFKGRRAGLIKALTLDVDKFYQQCDPEKENLCLYGLPNETWEVNLPVEEVPPELPEPALGINFARDGMQEKDWLSLVAVHSDSWLLAVAFYFGARFGFGKNERYGKKTIVEGVGRSSLLHGVDIKTSLISHFPSERGDVERVYIAIWEIYVFISDLGLMDLPLEVGRRSLPEFFLTLMGQKAYFKFENMWLKMEGFVEGLLIAQPWKRLFQMINDLPTIFEVVTGNVKQPKDQSATQNSSKSKSSGKTSRQSEPQTKGVKMSPPPKEDDESGEEEEEDDEQGATCGACGDNYGTDEFWICCDICERWFHGKCVKITPAKAEHIKQYKCPSCSNKRSRV
uniref:PHD finger protein ALFIN-LIKE n=1 Tax=Quercus lobata TaxID=97700 RepID=A0A7N2L262_QUELO